MLTYFPPGPLPLPRGPAEEIERKPVALITGASGEIGPGLIARLSEGARPVVTLDLKALDPDMAPMVAQQFIGSILDANLLEFAQRQGESHDRPVVFMYPSSIAAYGLPDLATKERAGRVKEDDFATPTTVYGCNKLYCEQLGRYYARHYKQLAPAKASGRVDFRGIRFPGLISAVTIPSGGTSDYAPEMIHAAARGNPTPAS